MAIYRKLGHNKEVVMTATDEGYTRIHRMSGFAEGDTTEDTGGGPLVHTDDISEVEGTQYIAKLLSSGYTEVE
jgi:hypothetical protein